MANVRMWRWNSSRREYALSYRHGLWRAIMLVRKSTSTGDERMNILAGKMHVPPRPTLFGKPEPIKLLLSRVALEADEVFLMLALIYSEARRQDRAVSHHPHHHHHSRRGVSPRDRTQPHATYPDACINHVLCAEKNTRAAPTSHGVSGLNHCWLQFPHLLSCPCLLPRTANVPILVTGVY